MGRCRVSGEEYAIAVVKPDQRIAPMKLDLFDDMEIFAVEDVEVDILGYISGIDRNPSIFSTKKGAITKKENNSNKIMNKENVKPQKFENEYKPRNENWEQQKFENENEPKNEEPVKVQKENS